MSDATSQRHLSAHAGGESAPHALGHAHGHAHPAVLARPPLPGASLLEISAGARLAGVALMVTLLWAGVFWALH